MPDRHAHRQAAQQRQRGHDEEAAAGADQAGDQADDDAVHQHPADGQLGVRLRGVDGLAAAQHGHRGGDHHQREGDHQQLPGQVPADAPAGERAGHAGQAEQQAGAPADATRRGRGRRRSPPR